MDGKANFIWELIKGDPLWCSHSNSQCLVPSNYILQGSRDKKVFLLKPQLFSLH